MDRDKIIAQIKAHKGGIAGILLGLLFGVLVLTIGFWKSIFLVLCICIGYWLGSSVDKKEKFLDFLDKILPKGFR